MFALALLFAAASAITLPQNGGRVVLLPSALAADGNASYAEVQSPRTHFVPFSQFQPRGAPISVWLKFSVAGPRPTDEPTWFLALPRWTESAELYRAGLPAISTSMYLPFAKRPAALDVPAFPILERDFGGAPLLLHLTYYPDTQLDVAFMTQTAAANAFEPTAAIEGMFFGVLLAVGALNLFVFATTRDENALWYVLWVVSLVFGELATSPIGDRHLWSQYGISARIMTYLGQFVSGIAFVMFARSFLRTKFEWPSADRVLKGFIYLYAVVQAAQLLVPSAVAITTGLIAGQVVILVSILTISIARYGSGFKPARYFALGFAPAVLGIGASLTWQTLQPSMEGAWFWAYNGGEVGIMLQTIVLSFGVADRLRTLERAIDMDELTGVASRRRFTETLDERISVWDEASPPFAVLFCDLDGFKRVNDRFGHRAGDDVLKIVGNRLIQRLRGDDLIARVGGDEFAVLLDDASVQQAATVARSLEKALEEPIIVNGATMPVGISIGMATFPTDGRTGAELLDFADERMYERKHRNKELKA